jgi:uncharacterized LabA/DUF88 family protein
MQALILATDMLVHATRKHYDAAVVVAGDEDYIPLIRAVQLHAFAYGSPRTDSAPPLQDLADYFVNLDDFLFLPSNP